MTGGPGGGRGIIAHLVAKRYPIGSRLCSSGLFSLDGKKNSSKLLSVSSVFFKSRFSQENSIFLPSICFFEYRPRLTYRGQLLI
jgi:hypothetical protein